MILKCCRAAAILAAAIAFPNLASAGSVDCASETQDTAVKLSGTDTAGEATITGCVLNADPTGIVRYAGIPYAEVPTGANRWQPPRYRDLPSSGAYTAFGKVCVQPNAYDTTGGSLGDEDCLTINVWAPRRKSDDTTKLPVMVFIYGGAFAAGSSAETYYDGSRLATEGVVVVSFNYRVGALGFLFDERIKTGEPIRGNFGLMDQQAALRWIGRHIASFGGDDQNITLFGESAGANSVALHTFDMPASAPLFHRAILESNPFGADFPTAAQVSDRGERFLTKLCVAFKETNPGGICDITANPATWQPRPPTADEIMRAQGSKTLDLCPAGEDCIKNLLEFAVTWTPVVDDVVVFGKPINGYYRGSDGKQTPLYKPILLGFNRNEGAVFPGLAFSNVASKEQFTEPAYIQALTNKFKDADGIRNTRCDGHPETDGQCYDPTHFKTNPAEIVAQGRPAYMNKVGAAIANVAGDFMFRCGTLKAANTLLADGNGQRPIHLYEFAQPPFYSFYNGNGTSSDSGVCEPKTSWSDPKQWPQVFYTCHGNELPYVFDTLDQISYPAVPAKFAGAEVKYTPTPGDRRLARTMTSAWAAFAKGAMPDWWPQYAEGGMAVEFQDVGAAGALRTIRPDKDANCSNLWLTDAMKAAYPK